MHYLRYNVLAQQADFLYRQGWLAEALASAHEAVELAHEHGFGAPVGLFWPQLQMIQLEIALQQRTIDTAIQIVERQRLSWTTEEEQAAIDYTIWLVDSSREHER